MQNLNNKSYLCIKSIIGFVRLKNNDVRISLEVERVYIIDKSKKIITKYDGLCEDYINSNLEKKNVLIFPPNSKFQCKECRKEFSLMDKFILMDELFFFDFSEKSVFETYCKKCCRDFQNELLKVSGCV